MCKYLDTISENKTLIKHEVYYTILYNDFSLDTHGIRTGINVSKEDDQMYVEHTFDENTLNLLISCMRRLIIDIIFLLGDKDTMDEFLLKDGLYIAKSMQISKIKQ